MASQPFPGGALPRGVPTKTVGVVVVGLLAGIALVGIFVAYLFAPAERDVIQMAGIVFGALSTISAVIFAYARSDDAATQASAANAQAQAATAQAEAATVVSQATKDDVAGVHELVNSQTAALVESRSVQSALEATLIERTAALHEAIDLAKRQTEEAKVMTVEAMKLATHVAEERQKMAVEAALKTPVPEAGTG